MDTKLDKTDSPINDLNRPGAYDDSNNDARWLGLNVHPHYPVNNFGTRDFAVNSHAAPQAPVISARTASATAPAPYSENVEIFRKNYGKFKTDMEANKLLTGLYSKFVIEQVDMELVRSAGPRYRQAEELMRIIHELHYAADSNRKMVISFFVHHVMSQSNQKHLAKLLDTRSLMPFEQYPEAVKKQITDELSEVEVRALTSHFRLNNATAREHDDNTHQAFGTKVEYPVQETGYNYNDW